MVFKLGGRAYPFHSGLSLSCESVFDYIRQSVLPIFSCQFLTKKWKEKIEEGNSSEWGLEKIHSFLLTMEGKGDQPR